MPGLLYFLELTCDSFARVCVCVCERLTFVSFIRKSLCLCTCSSSVYRGSVYFLSREYRGCSCRRCCSFYLQLIFYFFSIWFLLPYETCVRLNCYLPEMFSNSILRRIFGVSISPCNFTSISFFFSNSPMAKTKTRTKKLNPFVRFDKNLWGRKLNETKQMQCLQLYVTEKRKNVIMFGWRIKGARRRALIRPTLFFQLTNVDNKVHFSRFSLYGRSAHHILSFFILVPFYDILMSMWVAV